jgi:hypothetical protein
VTTASGSPVVDSIGYRAEVVTKATATPVSPAKSGPAPLRSTGSGAS